MRVWIAIKKIATNVLAWISYISFYRWRRVTQKTWARTVVLSIDEAPRDFLGLALLAMHLLGRGFRVVISDRPLALLARIFPEAVFMGKAGLRSANSFRGTLAFHPAEGAHFQESGWEATVLDKYFAPAMVKLRPEKIFAWGTEQVEILRRYDPALATKTIVSGAQRLDLCLKENWWLSNSAKTLIGQEFGDFILITTRFTTVNNDNLVSLTRKFKGRGDNPSDLVSRLDRLAQDSKDLGEFVLVIYRLLTEFPDRNFVIRPHPSENAELYTAFFGQFRNLTITRKGNFLPWLLSAKLMVTCNSTSGVEAELAGIPSVNFSSSSLPSDARSISVASEAGTVVHSIEEAVAACNFILQGNMKSEKEWSLSAKGRLENLNSPNATTIMSSNLAHLAEGKPPTLLPSLRSLGLLRKSGDDWRTAHSRPFGGSEGLSRDEVLDLFREAAQHGFPESQMVFSSYGTYVFESRSLS